MDWADEITTVPPVRRVLAASSPTGEKTAGSANPQLVFARALFRSIGQFVFALSGAAGLVLCLFSAVRAAVLFSQGAFQLWFGNQHLREAFEKLYDCGVVFVAAGAGVILLLSGLACRRWPKMLLAMGLTAAAIGAAPLLLQILLWAAAIVSYEIRRN
jgi:hypothetical protein